ncbi:MAG: hypothetical protein JEZ02_16210 [Desulfatibacillum sp.]|nr:hypothetical protein [Desulfatibacillum sp.]
MKLPDKRHIKKNSAYYLALDAEHILSLASDASKNKNVEAESTYSRSAILLYPIVLEALINMVYVYYEAYDEKELRKIDIKKKWLEAPRVCLPLCGTLASNGEVIYEPGDPIDVIDTNSELFKSYWELREIRNDIAHLKPCFKYIDSCDIDDFINKPELYPVTNIPKDISHMRFKHAEIAKNIFLQMVNELDRLFFGGIKWIMSSPLFEEKFIEVDGSIIPEE